jgi:hypothetical protein
MFDIPLDATDSNQVVSGLIYLSLPLSDEVSIEEGHQRARSLFWQVLSKFHTGG